MTKITPPEVLAPAGNYEKMKAAAYFGADAVYLGWRKFGMRSSADNFSSEELISASEYLHSAGKRMYVTLNTVPRGYEFAEIREFADFLKNDVRPDAVIVADLGVMTLCLDRGLTVHMSTQTGITSAETAACFFRLGARRAVLARELSLDEIKAIRDRTPPEMELEAFVHGAMCVSFSGRCLLSNYLAGRDANRGECAQPCRWSYHLIEEKRQDEPIPIEETDLGTFILGSRDMNMIEHIPELISAGISSFKIEGRMKSAYYSAVTSASYRAAVDAATEGKPLSPRWIHELMNVTHREYCTGFFFDDPSKTPYTCTHNGYLRECTYYGSALSYENGRAVFEQKNKLSEGMEAEIFSPGRPPVRFTVRDMRDENGDIIFSAPHPKMRFSLPVPCEVSAGDILRQA